MYHMKEQDEAPEKQLSEVEIGSLSGRKVRIMIARKIQDLRKKILLFKN